MNENFVKNVLKIKGSHRFETASAELLGFWFEGVEGEALSMLMQIDGIRASTESPCLKDYTKKTELTHEQAHGSIVIAWSRRFNKDDEKRILNSLKKNLKKLREMSPTWKVEK